MTPAAAHITELFRLAFAALDDHKNADERESIARTIAAHLRSQYPVAMVVEEEAQRTRKGNL